MEMGGGESSGVQLSAHCSVDFTSIPFPCCTLFLPVVSCVRSTNTERNRQESLRSRRRCPWRAQREG